MLFFVGATAIGSLTTFVLLEKNNATDPVTPEVIHSLSNRLTALETQPTGTSSNNEERSSTVPTRDTETSSVAPFTRTIIENVTKLIPTNEVLKLDDEVVLTTANLNDLLPGAEGGNPLYFDSENWATATHIYLNDGQLGIGRQTDKTLEVGGDTHIVGTLIIDNPKDSHLIELTPRGNTGYLSSSGGALYLNNTYNIGSGIGIFSDAGAEAEGNMINIKVDNPLFNQAAFYMNYDGTSNAVEIRANTNDRSSNALSLTNFNQLDSGLGVIGYELDRGSIKVSHYGYGSDSSASGLSIDLQGTGTAAQGIYVNSTAIGGTSGKLLRLRNESIDRFVVDNRGSLSLGAAGTDTSITKIGNNADDQFFVGTNGAFRVQRSVTDSEAFRVQVAGDTYGRWLGTADGKLKWSSGHDDYDVVMQRTAANTLTLLGGTFEAKSLAVNSDVMKWTASDGSRLGRVVETSGGHGWFEVDDSSGNAKIVFRADGGNNYVNSGNFGVGLTTFGTNANRVLGIANGTAPTTSIADGVQLFAADYDMGDGTVTSELLVRDEDGNVTTLSPHNFSLLPEENQADMDWTYYSEKNGKAINVNMAQVVRLVEQLTGQQLLYMKDLQSGESLRQLSLPGDSPFQTATPSAIVQPPTLRGQVVIPIDTIEVRVEFPSAFESDPIITVTPLNFISGSYRIQKNQQSFTLQLQQPQSEEVRFDWMAIQK